MMNLLQKRKNSAIFLCMMLYAQFSTAQNIEKIYVNMPDRLNPTLSKQNRLELIEYYKARQGDSVTNRFGNQAYIQYFDTIHSRLVVRNTPVSTFEMKLMSLSTGKPVIGIISTVCGSVCQSSIDFYDTAWSKVPIKFTMPKSVDWIDQSKLQTCDKDTIWIKNVLKTSFISLSFSKTDNLIEAKNCTPDFLSDADRQQVLPVLSDKIFRYKLMGFQWLRVP